MKKIIMSLILMFILVSCNNNIQSSKLSNTSNEELNSNISSNSVGENINSSSYSTIIQNSTVVNNSNNQVNSSSNKDEKSNYYVVTYLQEDFINLPSFAKYLLDGEESFEIIFTYERMMEVINEMNPRQYVNRFQTDMFEDNFILAYARYNNYPSTHKYYQFEDNVVGYLRTINIKSELVSQSDDCACEAKIDFILIPRSEIRNYIVNELTNGFKYHMMVNDQLLNLDENIEKAILDLYDNYGDEIYVEHYYGNYNGAHAYFIGGVGFPAVITYEQIGEYLFTYSSANQMEIYKDGKIYSLTEAYNLGYLDDTSVEKLYNKYQAANHYLYMD